MSLCHFCCEPARSNEDAWPLWLISKFDGVQAIMGADIGAKSQRWPTDTPRARIRCVCKRCNNEWMSQIESAAKLTIERRITSEATLLEPEAQIVLARWAIKTAMVFQAADRLREPFYSRAERAASLLVTASPTSTVLLMLIVALPTNVQDAPVLEL